LLIVWILSSTIEVNTNDQGDEDHLPTLTRRDLWRVGAVSIVDGRCCPWRANRPCGYNNADMRARRRLRHLLNLSGSPSQMDTFAVKEGMDAPPI